MSDPRRGADIPLTSLTQGIPRFPWMTSVLESLGERAEHRSKEGQRHPHTSPPHRGRQLPERTRNQRQGSLVELGQAGDYS